MLQVRRQALEDQGAGFGESSAESQDLLAISGLGPKKAGEERKERFGPWKSVEMSVEDVFFSWESCGWIYD